MQKLVIEEIEKELSNFPQWKLNKAHLCKTFKFNKFLNAIDFINKIAQIAETQKHHPQISNSHTTVEIKITTHDADGITNKDFQLASAIDEITRMSI